MINEKQIYSFSTKVNERDYLFVCPTEAPLGELYDVFAEMQFIVVKKMEQAQKLREEQADFITADETGV